MPRTPPHPILSQRFASSDVAFEKIDEEIAKLQEHIRALYEFRNTFTPTYRLPPEVLGSVFYFTQDAPIKEIYQRHRKEQPPSWLTVTLVSQHWRNVALGSPSLWSRIYDTYPKLIVWECLRRSKSVPLSVELGFTVSQDTQIVTSSISRARKLDLALYPVSWISLSENLRSPAPLLESLSISIPTPSIQIPMISQNTFSGMTPRLRHLALTGCWFDLKSSLFTSLVTLHLIRPHHKVSAEDLLLALHNCPHLASLKLFGVLDDSAEPIPSHQALVLLPALESLSIRGESMVQTSDILSHLSFPINMPLQLTTSFRSQLAELANLLNAHKSARRLPSIDSPAFTPCYELVLRNEQRFMLRMVIDDPELCNPIDPNSLFELDATVDGVTLGDLRLSDTPEVTSIFAALPGSSITKFTTNCGIGTTVWRDVLGRFPGLRHISAQGGYAVALFFAISNDCRTNKSNLAGWNPIFPALEIIDIQGTAFMIQSEDFLNALRLRKQVGNGLKRMEIAQCVDVDSVVIGALRHVVDCVMWDGSPREEEDEDEAMQDAVLFGPG